MTAAGAAIGGQVTLRQVQARGRVRAVAALLGPAFVASVAYVDPGNFATNFAGGAGHGYELAWVIVMASLMAMLVQYLTAKAGLATGRSLPELCRERFGRRANALLWLQAEAVAMATDLAEFVGAAVGINLLFGVPLLPAGLITAVVAFLILGLQQRGYRRFELAVIALLALVGAGLRVPVLRRRRPALPATGRRPAAQARRRGHPRPDRRHHRRDRHAARGLPALGPAQRPGPGVRARRTPHPADLQQVGLHHRPGPGRAGQPGHAVHRRRPVPQARADRHQRPGAVHAHLATLAGGGAALAFGVALMASGLSSSSVGTYAGQIVMAGFMNRRIPLLARRALTMTPSLIILALAVNTSQALVYSQIILSFGIPFALIPLLLITRDPSTMTDMPNRRLTSTLMLLVTVIITGLNLYLLYDAATSLL